MNLENIPTPETDRSETCVKHAHRILFDDDMVVESCKVRDIERRLTVAREALDGLNKLNLCGRAYEEIETALTQTAPKP